MKKSRIQLLVSLLFLLSSVALWYRIVPEREPSPPTPQVQEVAQDEITGVWEQYSLHNGRRSFMARLDLRSEGCRYMAYPLSLSEMTYPKHPYVSFDHKKVGEAWSFTEQWDKGELGYFDLTRNEDGEYEGFATSSTGYQFRTVFVKVR